MRAGDFSTEKKVPAWRGNAQISGRITDEAGKGIADARVSFVFTNANDGFFATTKKNGDSKNAPLAMRLKRDNSPELLAKAEAFFKAGQNAEARTEYMTVLAAHPELTAINRAIAFTYGREKNHPEALKYLDLALASNPNDETLLQLAAASAMEVSDYPRAMGYLGRIDEAAPADPDPLMNAAMNLLNRRRSAEATAVLTRVIARFPNAADAFFYRGYASMQANKPADAKPDLDEYLRIAPPDAQLVAQARDLLSKIK